MEGQQVSCCQQAHQVGNLLQRGWSKALALLARPWPLPSPTRTEVAAVHCVLTVKKEGSLRSATTPSEGDGSLSLPIKQQLKKVGNTCVPTLSGCLESSTELVHPSGSHCRCSEHSSRGGERAVVWKEPFPTSGPPSPHCFGPGLQELVHVLPPLVLRPEYAHTVQRPWPATSPIRRPGTSR